ncbi:uncharacterized protein LOC116441443 isoform X3 [Corvus moneduloides]|uniref:uncharacterized protein LOC116441443 isoform X3 n=1 Tax=Corvus moneduloides TaxID=1196302 RepID=UPI001363C53F|nr:uncharacterized protein LOC116441443 isoform X3 [Corvus moneduloides]
MGKLRHGSTRLQPRHKGEHPPPALPKIPGNVAEELSRPRLCWEERTQEKAPYPSLWEADGATGHLGHRIRQRWKTRIRVEKREGGLEIGSGKVQVGSDPGSGSRLFCSPWNREQLQFLLLTALDAGT